MNRPLLIWTIFAACVMLALAAMGYVSVMVIDADRREAAALRRAAVEENVRLALWRMDSALTPLIARENSRPYEVYQRFYPVRAFTPQMTPLEYGQVLLASPLRGQSADGGGGVTLHFQLDVATGELSSPYDTEAGDWPLDAMKHIPDPQRLVHAAPPLEYGFAAADALAPSRNAMASADVLVAPPPMAAAPPLPAPGAPPAPLAPLDDAEPLGGARQQQEQVAVDAPQAGAVQAPLQQRNTAMQQQALSEREYQQRARSQALSNRFVKGGQPPAPQVTGPGVAGAAGAVHVVESHMMPLWLEGELFLLRRVSVDGRELIQGVWLDWPAIEQWLLGEIADLLPEAKLERSQESGGGSQEAAGTRLLASAPIRLLPGKIPSMSATIPGVPGAPMRTSLLIAWGCIVLAVIAVTALLRVALVLSERRGAFVSAVTHELRTPLTTFSLYTQMLAQGMVVDAAKRQSYLDTLHRESQRLSHLVENVLAYARLERTRRNGDARQRVSVGDLIGRMSDRLAARADEAEMQLIVNLPPETAEAVVETDLAAVERIVFNLVDNACKYACGGADGRIELSAERRGWAVLLRVRDHGPGIAADARRRLFRPFSKSAQAAAQSAPGVGLGLALTQRLARSLGGELKLERVAEGTCFVLRLPLMK